MTFKEIIDSPCGIRYCFDLLELQSGYARKYLLDSRMMTTAEEIEEAYASLDKFTSLVEREPSLIQNLQFRLQGLRNIYNTLTSLEEGSALDDIELFEIKHLALLGDEVKQLFSRAEISNVWTNFDLDNIIRILDPDGLKIGTFYVYDSYSMEVRKLRRELESDPDNEELKDRLINEEERIKRVLCNLLRPYATELTNLLHSLAELDIVISKAIQRKKESFTIPEVGNSSSFEGLFHPEVKSILAQKGKVFQKVAFRYKLGEPGIIIGANMGGKTVALKSLCLCQYLFQFGFAVPALKAEMVPVENIVFCFGDDQDQQKGLSSFAAEMLRIDRMIEMVESGAKTLALVDEPARTTNPTEGSALVSSLLRILTDCSNLSLILTTHYNVDSSARCWRVKGLVEDIEGSDRLKMDYSLTESADNEVPHEALNIARKLGVSSRWLDEATKILDTQ
jgi:dsDNA-specific endonuclease/ATPase MutS2